MGGSGGGARVLRAVLTHPLALAIKTRLRAREWAARSSGLANPATPARVDSALFVCLGNICRSPFAAKLAAQLLAGAGRRDLACASAGIRPSQAARSPLAACTAAARFGIALDDHLPQLLTRELVAASDVVFVMEAAQLERLRESFPDFRDRIFLLSLYDDGARDAFERCNIVDPFGQPDAAFDACYARIERALLAWVAELAAASSQPQIRSAAESRSPTGLMR